MKKIACILFFFFCFATTLMAQTTIGGVVNIYTPVISIGCNSANVVSTAGFAPGDRALIIQMKGAVIDSSNTSAFGTVMNYADCGNYEFVIISSITGTTVFFQYQLLNSYSPAGRVQLIRVPQYTNTTATSMLTCAAWNGLTGGVLVMEVSGTLTLNADIDVSGKGFRGGTACTNPDGGCGIGYADYYYPVTSGYGAAKGEGITDISSTRNGGRGALASGGGGGNKHNSGGGGGSNFSAGGVGGKQANFCPSVPVGGVGGYPMNYTLNKIFLGGGGGCSDNNNGVGTTGGNGGGIILIRAANITGNNDSIRSDGNDVGYIINGIGDGAGGGGAGGTILLDVPAYTTNVYVTANGGDGGDQYTTYGACFGTGGGGGTGLIYASTPSLPVNVITATIPGTAGTDLYPSSSCYTTSYGAAPGQTASGIKYDLLVPEDDSLLSLPPVSVNLGNDTLLCSGSPITLNASNPGASYLWSTGATSSSIAVSSTGTYWVTVSFGSCPSVSDTISIINASSLSVSLGNDTLICEGDSILLNAYNPGTSYTWSTGSSSSSIVTGTAGTYWVTVSSGACAIDIYDTIVIATSAPPSVNLGNDTLLCSGSLVLDAGNPGAVYSWSTGAVTQTISAAPGTYWVNVQAGACPAENDTISIISPAMISASLGNDTTICNGDSLLLNVYNPGVSYVWSTGASSSSITTGTAGTYWVNVTSSACAVSVYDTINISTDLPPLLELGNDTLLCSGSIILDAGNPGATFFWSNGANTQTVSAGTGTFWVTVADGVCPSVSDTIHIFAPTTGAGTEKDTSICAGPVTLTASAPGSSYLWSTGASSASIVAENAGTYWVNITDICLQTITDTITITGTLNENTIFVPNVFSPNSDNQNDVITVGQDDGLDLNWKIYNRWGQSVYSEKGRKLSWNGYYGNQPLDDGTYFWILEYDSYCTGKKESVVKKGFTTIVR